MVREVAISSPVIIAFLATAGCGSHEVLYKGQPAQHWVRQIEDRDFETRSRALLALGEIAPDGDSRLIAPALAAALMDWLHHQDRYSGEDFDGAILRLIRKGGPAWAAPVVPALVDSLQNPDQDVRLRAVYSLSGLGPLAKSAEPELRKLLQDSSGSVREEAEAALKDINEAPEAGAVGN